MASGKHLMGACSTGLKGKLSSFLSYPGGDGRGVRTVQMRWADYRNPM